MPLLDNQISGFKTQLHENSDIDLTQNFYPGNPERQVLESNRECHDSNHERQKVKNTKSKKKLSKMNVFRNIYWTTTTIQPTKDSNSSELS